MICRIVEELFPFIAYSVNYRKVRKQAESDDILDTQEFAGYGELSKQQILERLTEEHQRATTIDEKTSKLILSLSVGLAFLGVAASFLIKVTDCVAVQRILTLFIGVGVLYLLSAGWIAVGALRTLKKYGYGTRFLLEKEKGPNELLVKQLAKQEKTNTLRHLRNEAASQALRNGLVLLFIGILGILIVRLSAPFSTNSDAIQARRADTAYSSGHSVGGGQ